MSEPRSRRSFFVETLSGLAGGWAALTGGGLLATQLAGCPQPVKYGGPPPGPPPGPPRSTADAGEPPAPAGKYGGPPDTPPPVAADAGAPPATTKYGGPSAPPPPFVTKYGGPPPG